MHHIDGDYSNNELNNLDIVLHGNHQKFHNPPKYQDKVVNCSVCGKEFLFTAKQQRTRTQNKSRGRTIPDTIYLCSKSCTGKYSYEKYMQKHSDDTERE